MIRISVCLLGILLSSAPQSARPEPARALVTRAIDAVGGVAALKSVASLQLESIGHEYFIDQSERPEGPFVTTYLQTAEKRDVTGGRSRIESQQRFMLSPEWTGAGTATVVDADAAAITRGDRSLPAGRQAFDEGRERIELAPERLLLAALAAPDLAAAPDARVHGIIQRVVTFGWRGKRARLLIDSGDFIPTALETSGEDSSGVWGTVRQTTYYSLWTLIPGGVRYPLQVDRDWNGLNRSSATIVKIAVNQPVDDKTFAIPDEVKKAFAAAPATGFAALKVDPAKRVEIAADGAGGPEIVQLGGNWNVGVVRQPDGLVIIEAPIGSPYSVQILEEVAKRYQGVHVKAVVTTSDAWPHLGGVREYVARGIPVYALDLNQPILERLLKADYGAKPDALAKAPKTARFTWVSGKTTIGVGDTRIELYPLRGENGERMMAAYFPALKVLYSSDEIMRQRDGRFFMPEFLLEVRDMIQREHLQVDRVFGMHIGSIPWSEIEAAIAQATASVAAPAAAPKREQPAGDRQDQ
jgi:glyoxylase-like metal-dependent hydrolase (beta-lactamase superfamily II)